MFHRVMLAVRDFAISRSMMPRIDDRGDRAETKVAHAGRRVAGEEVR